jgi:hypothetical protein
MALAGGSSKFHESRSVKFSLSLDIPTILALMPVRSCRVTIQDMDGVSHTVEVTATTPYEAVALRRRPLFERIGRQFNPENYPENLVPLDEQLKTALEPTPSLLALLRSGLYARSWVQPQPTLAHVSLDKVESR